MYSFEGDFRRKPQQNLAGASARQNMSRDALIQKAQQERMKREEHRKRLTNTIRIQAYVRSFITRIKSKQNERLQFDSGVLQNNSLGESELILLIRRLLFFYDQQKDSSRLIYISQQLLKQWTKILQSGGSFLQIRRLLALHLKLLNAKESQGRDSMAVPLRMLEVFTGTDSAKQVMDNDIAEAITSQTLVYLIKRGYFKEMRLLLENKTPPLYGKSPNPPTPFAASIFDLIQRPFKFVHQSDNTEYSNIVMVEFASSILCNEMSEVIRDFVLPALYISSSFPYVALVWYLSNIDQAHTKIEYSSWLLYALLSLQPSNFVQSLCESNLRQGYRQLLSHPVILNYLSLMVRLTSNLCCKNLQKNSNKSAGYSRSVVIEGDSDSDLDEPPAMKKISEIHLECLELLNNSDSCILYVCVHAVENDWNEYALEHISGICHYLLLSYKMAVHKYKVLYTLAFKPWFLRALWSWLSTLDSSTSTGSGTSGTSSCRGGTLLASLTQGLGARAARLLAPLATFCSLYSLLVATLHDEEFGESDTAAVTGESSTIVHSAQAFSFSQLGSLSVTLRQVCTGLIELAFPEHRLNVGHDYRITVFKTSSQEDTGIKGNFQDQTAIWAHLFKVSVRLLRQLHTRDQRMQFTRGEWEWCGGVQLCMLTERPLDLLHQRRHHRLRHRPFSSLSALTREECEDGPPLTTKEIRTLTILKEIPFVVPFSQRVLIFQGLILKDKQDHQGEQINFLQGPSIQVVIRRSHLYEDAFDKLSPQNEPDLRLKMRVQLMNEVGLEEAGVDGGGVFREFLSELLRAACDPNRGFFRLTRDNMLYPNPAVHMIVNNFQPHYYFIGRMLGKALYEGLLVELPFAEFFLQALVGEEGRVGGEADIHRLGALDERLHKSLLQLRALPAAAVSDLGLDFTVMSDELGEQKVEELKLNGANIAVTAENRIEYIHLVAEWKLSRQVRAQVTSTRQGLASVIPLAWLRIFCARELRLLVSGAESAVDVDDLKKYTNYTGGYVEDHPTIMCFWKVVSNFTDIQKRQLLKFVTSCSRPPLLGFKDLDPPFCIQNTGFSERLPTASTCMNLLKLPEFRTESVLKEKLLYAINAGAGFELS